MQREHSPVSRPQSDMGSLDWLRYQRRLDCAISASRQQKARQVAELLEDSLRYPAQRLLRYYFVAGLHPVPKEQVVLTQAASPCREQGVRLQAEGLKYSLLLSKPAARTCHLSLPSSGECPC